MSPRTLMLRAGVALASLGLVSAVAAGTIEGVLTSSTTGQPLANQTVSLRQQSLGIATVQAVQTDAMGHYRFEDVSGSFFYLVVQPTGHVGRVHGNVSGVDCAQPFLDFGCYTLLPSIQVSANQTLDRPLTSSPAARLSGRVRGQGGVLLDDALVSLGGPQFSTAPNVSPTTGDFFIDHILPGSYAVRACAGGWICRDPEGVESDEFGADAPTRLLDLVAGQTVVLDEIQLRPAARLSGRAVLPANTLFVNSPLVDVYRDGVLEPVSASSLVDADFVFDRLRPGTFRVRFARPDDLVWHSLWFGGAPCTPGSCDPASGAPINIASGALRDDIREIVPPRQSISGVVRSAQEGTPIAGITVTASQWTTLLGPFLATRTRVGTDANGVFQLSGLQPGAYVLQAERGQASGLWVAERWPEVRCSVIDTPCLIPNQHQFQLPAAQQVTDIEFTLELGGTLGGQVRAQGTGALTNAGVQVRSASTAGSLAVPLADGQLDWRSAVLPVGTYQALAFASNATAQVFDGINCAGTCVITTGTPIALQAAAERDDIDFALPLLDAVFRSGFEP